MYMSSKSKYVCSIVSVHLRLIDNVASAILSTCFIDVNETSFGCYNVIAHFLNYDSKKS
jgi:hypothetical protein